MARSGGRGGKKHEIATPLGAALKEGWFAREDLARLIDAREMEAEPEIADLDAFMHYARGTSGMLARIAGKTLGVNALVVEDLGTAYGISGILRAQPFLAAAGRSLLPQDGTKERDLILAARLLLRERAPKQARAAVLPAVFARRDLGRPYRPRGLGDKLAVIRAALFGGV